jgi:hypothetical protein
LAQGFGRLRFLFETGSFFGFLLDASGFSSFLLLLDASGLSSLSLLL